MSTRDQREPTWYQRRSAVFALVFAIGFFGGWAISLLTLGRYEPAFATIGANWGARGPLEAYVIATAIVVIAMAVRIWGSSYLSAATVWDEQAHSDVLVVAGPFRFVRHPLYAANLLLAFGLGAAAPLPGWMFILVADAIFIRSLIVFEDKRLRAVHGDAFESYRRHVPALLPRLVPVVARHDMHPSLSQGLRAESFSIFVFGGIMALFAVPRYGAFVLAGAYIAGVLVQRRIEGSDRANKRLNASYEPHL